MSNPVRARSHRLIMTVLASVKGRETRLLSMQDLSVMTGIPVHLISARLSDLVPTWITVHEGACESSAKPGLRVNGYELSAAGSDRWYKANTTITVSGSGSKEEAAA